MQPIILVTGATGAQGGSVAKALLKSGKYAVRALTRNTNSEKARALAAEGAILVKGDLDDPASLDAAMQDCYGVFGVTNFWEHFVNEYRQGKNLADAVHRAGVQHFIYSSLPSYHQLSEGKFPVPHCDGKAAIAEYIRSLSIPHSLVHMPFYYENFLTFFPPQKGEDGAYHFGFPQGNTQLAMCSVEDIGGIVTLMFDNRDLYLDRTVGVVGEDRRCSEYAAIMSRVLGVTVRYDYIPHEEYAVQNFPGAEELANMFEVQRQFIPQRWSDQMEAYHMYIGMQPFESWMERNKDQFLDGPLVADKAAILGQTSGVAARMFGWLVLVLSVLLTMSGCNVPEAKDAPHVVTPDSTTRVKRGEYLVNSMGCDDCHSTKKMGEHGPEIDLSLRFAGYPAGRPLAKFDTTTPKSWALLSFDGTACVGPWGTTFAANITSDATGIGNWTEDQFIKCLREGKWKGLDGGRPLLPPMPWPSFGKLSNDDLKAIFSYLKTTKPIRNTVPEPLPPGVIAKN